MPRGRKPTPRTNIHEGLGALPRCPAHLSDAARREWRRLAPVLHGAGILTVADRAVLAAYCQAYARWVEAEEHLGKTPALLKTPSGYVQQSPWLSIANKQMEIMGRYMTELGLTPAARTRLDLPDGTGSTSQITTIELVTVYTDENGKRQERPLDFDRSQPGHESTEGKRHRIELDEDL